MVSCSQPLAAEAGLRVLQAGGNAADAAVAVAAALGVTEPCSTGTHNRRSLLPCMSIYLYVYICALLYVSLSLSLSLFVTYTNNLCAHTGIGGDAFALYYDASQRSVSCLQVCCCSAEDLIWLQQHCLVCPSPIPLNPCVMWNWKTVALAFKTTATHHHAHT